MTDEGVATIDAPSGRVGELQTAWLSQVGSDLSPDEAEALAGWGWTADAVARVADLGRDSLERGTALGRLNPGRSRAMRWACNRLRLEAVRMRDLGVSLSRALEWLAVLAAAPSEGEFDAVTVLLRGGRRVEAVTLTAWFAKWDAAAGPLAPLAYAAGLTTEETIERYAAGTLDPEALRVLALLRGYRLPDWAIESSSA